MSQHSSPMVTPERPRPRGIAHYLALAERFVLIMIAIVLSVLAVLLLVGLLPLALAGILLSRRSADELRATFGCGPAERTRARTIWKRPQTMSRW